MNKPTKIFIAGTGLAAGLAAFCAITNAWNAQRAEGLTEQLETLTKECKVKEGVISQGPTSIGAPIGSFDSVSAAWEAGGPPKYGPDNYHYYDLVKRNGRYSWQLMLPGDVRCTSIVLAWWSQDAAHAGQFDDVQRALAEKQKEAWDASTPMELPYYTYYMAFGIFLISALPVVMVSSWYFLLRRIGELSAAIRGRG
jgi:hypothetical protein